MNIQKIYSADFNRTAFFNRVENAGQPFYGIRMSQPLSCDTVSFRGGRGTKVIAKEVKAAIARQEARAIRDINLIAEAKRAPEKAAPTKKNLSGEERKQGISISTAKKIRNMILHPQERIHDFMGRIFGDLVVSEISPKNLILYFSDRAKSEVSLMEKCATRDLNSIEEVLKGRTDTNGNKLEGITDLNGSKIVMNFKTGKTDTENTLSRLIPLIKTGQVTLHEIELQRPSAIKTLGKKEQEEFDYVSKAFLDKLEDAQEEVLNGLETNVDNIKLINRPLPKYTKFNYCALHLLLQLNEKGSRPFEMQIMGPRTAKGKIFDDKRFKFFDGKQLDKKYDDLVKMWEPFLSDENKDAKDRFLTYCKDANFQLRLDEIYENKKQKLLNKTSGFFKSIREYNLPPEYDLNEQFRLMQECDKKIIPEETKKSENHVLKIKVLSKSTVKKMIQKITPGKPKD